MCHGVLYVDVTSVYVPFLLFHCLNVLFIYVYVRVFNVHVHHDLIYQESSDLYCIVLYSMVWYDVVLYCIVLYGMVLYCIVLYCIDINK